jgi:hypothetical protein
MSTDVVMYGLQIRSEIPLSGRRAPAEGTPDLEIVLGPKVAPPDGPPPGEVLAHYELNPAQWYTFARQGAGDFVMRFASAGDFIVNAGLRRVVVCPEAGADPALVPVFANGAVPAFVLMMRGDPLLHASAIDVGGRAVAFVGRSGMGKSTMATLFCAAGGRLITDDVLRLTPGDQPRCYLGAGELRLRKGSEELAESFADPPSSRRTGDGRDALQPALAETELLPLTAIVIPWPDREASTPVVERLGPVEALMTLMSFPRIIGWKHGPTQALQFQRMGDVAAAVPVYSARVPWGPPFPADLAPTLLESIGASDGPDQVVPTYDAR